MVGEYFDEEESEDEGSCVYCGGIEEECGCYE